ncbi:hypothetical protein [Nocardia fluminea]|uniref:hypothetical protein n=1 Tax=Nocardia fluminea TaxID=134984 RepID=UPI003656AEF7
MSSEHRPTDEQLRDWLEEGGFPAYFTDEHGQYLDAMFAELLELRAELSAMKAADQWTASLPPTDPLMTEADRMACEWSDYRKDYADGLDPNTYRHVHEAFKSGWEAAQGKTFEGGPLR